MIRCLSSRRGTLVRALALVCLLLLGGSLTVPSAAAGIGLSVRGGGVVDGPPGVTSQLGLVATDKGGSFLCVMAGRSGGFPFGSWDSISQMQVQGRVTPGTLTVEGDVSLFEGIADIHVVGKADGVVIKATLTDVRFVSTQRAGGAGTAWHLLEIPDLELAFGPAPMKTGHISLGP